MGLTSESQREELYSLVRGLHALFAAKDCLLVEVNPLVETEEGSLRVADAKLNFDDNAQFRQKALFEQRDTSQENSGELEAEKYNLNYIKLDGQIGCMVNGAGLAMATMDLIQLKGGSPANFLDVGGSAEEQQIVQALNIIQNDPDAKAVLVNIFGGIMRCDIIAQGLIKAIKHLGFTKPLVIRLEGTNKAQAEELLRGALQDPEAKGLQVEAVNDFDGAAERAVQLARELQRLAIAGTAAAGKEDEAS
ncbi:succinate-coenzyme a beta subunit [Cyclospora cayetanensis]|nr:succinate-coenzyme a beta subunit [Cyclospora cayetanensis]